MNQPDAMRVFVRVAELGSFTQAAEGLGLPKASASIAVKQLEAQLGTRLLQRTTRRVQLTHDGEVFYERCKDLLADLDELGTLFQRGAQALRGRLRVDMSAAVAREVVIPRLPEFLAEHPLLEVELSCTDRRVDLVREGFDCVVRVGTLADSGLVARPLGELVQINCASPAYVARFGVPRALDDLARHRLIHYVPVLGARPVGWEYLDADGTPRTHAMPGALTVNNVDAYRAACVAGLGLIQAPATALRPMIEAGQLVEVMHGWQAPSMPMSLLVAHRRHLPRRVQALMEWLTAVLRPYVART